MSQYQKIAINFTKEEKEKLDEIVAREQGVTRSDLVREAVDYYLGYYVQRESVNYVSPIISETIKSILHHFEDNISELIFKLAVEVSKNNIITAHQFKFDDELLNYFNTVSRQLVAEHNGVVDLKTAQDYLIEHDYLNSGDEWWQAILSGLDMLLDELERRSAEEEQQKLLAQADIDQAFDDYRDGEDSGFDDEHSEDYNEDHSGDNDDFDEDYDENEDDGFVISM